MAVYNYLETPQTIYVQVQEESWFTLLGASAETITLGPGEVGLVRFPVHVNDAGWHTVTVKGDGITMNDAVARTVEVIPDGQRHEHSVSGKLEGNVHHDLLFPEDVIPGSPELFVKIYPGLLSQIVEGLDCLLLEPFG